MSLYGFEYPPPVPQMVRDRWQGFHFNPEDYPDIHKLAILADVAPYSREYNTWRQKVGSQAHGHTELEIEYEKILRRVKQTREW